MSSDHNASGVPAPVPNSNAQSGETASPAAEKAYLGEVPMELFDPKAEKDQPKNYVIIYGENNLD